MEVKLFCEIRPVLDGLIRLSKHQVKPIIENENHSQLSDCTVQSSYYFPDNKSLTHLGVL